MELFKNKPTIKKEAMSLADALKAEKAEELVNDTAMGYVSRAQYALFLLKQQPCGLSDVLAELENSYTHLSNRLGFITKYQAGVSKEQAEIVEKEISDNARLVTESIDLAFLVNRVTGSLDGKFNLINSDTVSSGIYGPYLQLKESLETQSRVVRSKATENTGIRVALEKKLKEIKEATNNFEVEFVTGYHSDALEFSPYRQIK